MHLFPKAIAVACTLSAAPIYAQDVDRAGADIPILTKLDTGGVALTGKYISRAEFEKKAGRAFTEKYGFPKAMSDFDGTQHAIYSNSLNRIDHKLGGDGAVENPKGEIEVFKDGTDPDPEFAIPPEVINSITPIALGAARKPLDLDQVAQENGPIELFTDDELGAITLLDGRWKSTQDDVSIDGCPPGVGQAAAQFASEWVADVTFTKKWWQPSDFPTDIKSLTWQPVGPNGYFSQPYSLDAEGSGMAMTISMAMHARDPSTVKIWARINMRLAPALAAMAQSSTNCVATVSGRYLRLN